MAIVSARVRFTSLDLYRSGNARGPRLTDLRLKDTRPDDPDIEIGVDGTGALIAKGDSGGVSVWERPDFRWRKVWMLPAGSGYHPDLRIWSDAPPHWLIAPANDMFLTDYVAALNILSVVFVRVE